MRVTPVTGSLPVVFYPGSMRRPRRQDRYRTHLGIKCLRGPRDWPTHRCPRQTHRVTTVTRLRSLGPKGLAELLALRPDAVGPVLPLSLVELAARLAQPRSLLHAVQRLDTPALQVAEALAHLGPDAGRTELVAFLGLEAPAELAALDRSLGALDARGLLAPRGGLVADLLLVWESPYRLGPRLALVLATWTVDRLRPALLAWGEHAGGRKADLMSRLSAVLADGPRVREALAGAPEPDRRALLAAAEGGGHIDLGYVSWDGRVNGRPSWTLVRGLGSATWEHGVVMPAEVALAIRGPHWRPPFDWQAPPLTWTPVDHALADREATAAASRTVRLVTALVAECSARPAGLNRDGTLGVRELKRLAKALRVEPREVRFAIGLAFAGALVAHTDAALAPTAEAEDWLASPPADRLAALLRTWSGMLQVPLASPDEKWDPMPDSAWGRRRWVPLEVLSTGAGSAPADPAELVRACVWLTPEGGPDRVGNRSRQDPAADVSGLLAEAALLGLTGAGALSTLGETLVAGDDPAPVLGAWLGRAQETARLQSDLTAVVLGDPSARLVRVLDAMADREAGDQATTWRFSAASVARALDAGQAPDALLAALSAVADDDVPQPLAYLVRDTGRRHGALRAGAAACYVRSDDHARLAEAAADSRLRRLGLRLLGPGVLIGERPLDETLARLRAAGYLPVHEAADGAAVPVRRDEVRAKVSDYVRSTTPPPAQPGGTVTEWDIAQAMLGLPDGTPASLFEIDGTVIDSRSMPDVFGAGFGE